ncbi:MAG: TIGR04219 family outer membrane beta-barrel protein [Gammaproteobacteria bacterium]|nr:TIGR04219 family outer membrane beta-barrel protein [Gammaproteobacteria bacterium]
MSTTRTVTAISACMLLAIGTAEAEFIGLNIGANPATAAHSGAFSNNSSSIDLVDDLDADSSTRSSMVFILEHPIAVLPNVRYQGYNLDSSDTSGLNSSIGQNGGLNGGMLGAAGNGKSAFDLDHEDIVLYYQLLNNWVDLDMGVDLKRFDGQISQTGDGDSVSVDETIPLLYLSARIDLPVNGMYLGASINANVIDLGISESTAQDSTLLLGYQSGTGLGFEGGIKYFSLELNDADNLNSDFEYDGLFLNGYINF